MHPSEDKWERSCGYVYFIAAGDPSIAVKIGISTERDLKRRFSTIQSSNHEPLSLLGVIRFEGSERPMLDAQRHEKSLHVRFARLQRMQSGWTGSEWFTATPELMEYVSSVTSPPHEHDLPCSVARHGPGLDPCR